VAHRILRVDDERGWRSIVALYFDCLGYETLPAEDSAQAICKTIDEQPNLIVIDMNGIEATVALKRDPYTSKIPVVVVTGMADARWKEEALKAGVSKYIVKPISLSELGAIVKTLV